jgi:transposase
MAFIKFPQGFMEIDFHRYYQITPCARGRMRCLAMLHLQRGKTIEEVSEIVQQSRVSISHWLRWLREEGEIERLVGYVKGRGGKSKISSIDEETIRLTIEKLSKEKKGGRITGKDIQKMIKEKWDIEYALSSIYVLLKRLKLVWITSRSKHPQMDEKIQEDFKKTSPAR